MSKFTVQASQPFTHKHNSHFAFVEREAILQHLNLGVAFLGGELALKLLLAAILQQALQVLDCGPLLGNLAL